MSDFTMRLKDAIRALGGTAEVVDGLMVVTGDIGLSHYPIFDEKYRPILNGKIVRHYWNEEIGVETPDLFKFNLETDMAEYMPYFNQLYDSERMSFDPFSTIDIRTFGTGKTTQDTVTDTSSATENGGTTYSQAVNSTLPQNQLARNKDYATSGAQTTGENTSSGTGSESTNASVIGENEDDSRTSGYQGLPTDMLMRYRESFLNIDVSVIEALGLNFMLIKSSGSRYTDRFTWERYTI